MLILRVAGTEDGGPRLAGPSWEAFSNHTTPHLRLMSFRPGTFLYTESAEIDTDSEENYKNIH